MIAGTVDALRRAQAGALDAIARLRSVARDYTDHLTAEATKTAEDLAAELEELWASAKKGTETIESRLQQGAWERDKKVDEVMRGVKV